MSQKFYWICYSLGCLLVLSYAQKCLIFTQIQCPVKSNLVTKVNCYLESSSSLAVEVTTTNKVIPSLVGMAKINLYIHGRKNVMRLNGFRLEICKVLSSSTKPSMVTFLYTGIQKTENNLHKCPFKPNYTYTLHHMKFDANYLPSYLPEYNFSFVGDFIAENVSIFEVRVRGSFCNINHDCSGLNISQT